MRGGEETSQLSVRGETVGIIGSEGMAASRDGQMVLTGTICMN